MRKKLIKSEVMQLYNTTKETLRHYEKKGLIQPEIDDNNYRYYGFAELEKLRQIFLFRDLDFSLEQMKALETGQIDPASYKGMLVEHYRELQQKIKRLQEVEGNIQHILALLEGDQFRLSFSVRDYPERWYYRQPAMEHVRIESPKDFYDMFQDMIEQDSYSEQTFFISYPYESLQAYDSSYARLCYEITDSAGYEDDLLLHRPAGAYLSLFYSIQLKDMTLLEALHGRIEAYLEAQGLVLSQEVVLEQEHPEFGILLEEGTSVYELQIGVKRKNE